MKKKRKVSKRVGKQYYYWLMIAPCLIFLFIFSYYPMSGILMAFQDFKLAKGIWGSEWVGLYHFKVLFSSDIIWRILRNTVVLALGKCFITMFMGIAFAILLNEIRIKWLKKSVQTLVYLPHFLSWVILAGVVGNLFRVSGVVNGILTSLGFEAVNFLVMQQISNRW